MILNRFVLNKMNLGQLKSSFFTHHSRLLSQTCKEVDIWSLKSTYPWFLPVQTRWKDNDQYSHMNNAVYHAIFDSVINVYLIRHVGLVPDSATEPRGFMVTNRCKFTAPTAYPDVYMAGLAVVKLGNSSVRYKLGLFPLHSPSLPFPCDLVLGHWSGSELLSEPHSQGTEPRVLARVVEVAAVTGDSTHVFVDPANSKPTPIPQDWRQGLANILTTQS